MGFYMKVATIFLKYDYGLESRGLSLEYTGFFQALKQITPEVYPFWFDSYLNNKEELQQKVISFVDTINPDIVFFVLMNDEFTVSTLDYLKNKYITINWFGDDTWRFENFTARYAPHFTYSITTDKASVYKYENMCCSCILSQWASFDYVQNFDLESNSYIYDVSFIGGKNEYRFWVIKKLKQWGINVECFGNGWNNGRVSYAEMGQIFAKSKINLNISNSTSNDVRYIFSSINSFIEYCKSSKRSEQMKARNFEIPCFGGFQLTNYVFSLEDYFKIGEEVAIYSSLEDLFLQVKYFLNHDSERKEFLIKGYNRAVANHTYFNRLRYILSIVVEGSL